LITLVDAKFIDFIIHPVPINTLFMGTFKIFILGDQVEQDYFPHAFLP